MNAVTPASTAPIVEPEGEALVAVSRRVLATHARSFRWAGALLPRHQLDEAAVIYAFCRLVDDLADESPDPGTARRHLGALRAELRAEAHPRDLVAATVSVLDRGVGVAPAVHLIDGVLSDLEPVRLPDDAALHRYSYAVAGTVGLMMCAVLGVHAPEAWPFAVDLGVGMQITNICRDVREDAARGRIYLPADRLESAGVPGRRLLEAAAGGPALDDLERGALAVVVRDLLDDADRYYRSADAGMRFIPLRARLAIRVASRVYRGIGVRLRRHGGDPWQGRTVVGWTGKLGWTLAATGATLAHLIAGRPPHDPHLHRHLRDRPGCHA